MPEHEERKPNPEQDLSGEDDMLQPDGMDWADEAPVGEQPADTAANALSARIEELAAERDRMKDHMLRALADAENTRKRAQRDREDASKYAVSSFARDLLDFSMNFRRALSSIPPELKETDERVASLVTGIEAMEKELLNTFDKHGIRKIEPMDIPFDPNFHEVMFEAPSPDKAPGTIIQLIEPGYMLHDRLLRPARVGIARDDGQGGGTGNRPGDKIDQQA